MNESTSLNHCVISGRIESSSRKFEESFYTAVLLPADSPFDKPGLVEIRSSRPLGKAGTDFEGVCRCGGYARFWNYLDKNTGETEKRRQITNSFVFVETVK